MWKSAIALSMGVVVGGGCRGHDGSEVQRGSAGSDLVHVEQALAEIVATISDTSGNTEVRRKGQVRWEKADVGSTFRERDWVRTGPHSTLRLRFATGGFLDLAENTTLLVDSGVTVDTGTVVGVTDSQRPFEVNAADGSHAQIAAAAGEPVEFRLTPSANKTLEIAVTKGALKVTTPNGEQIVAAGEATDLAQRRTGPIVKLLGFPKSLAPGVDARFLFSAGLEIPLAWAKVPDAAKYYVQVAHDTEFHDLVETMELTTLKTSFSPDAEGMYVWRVAARDASGRLGEFGFARRVYCENDEPREQLIGPRDGFKIDYPNKPPQVVFSWKPIGDVKQYKLVIDRDGPGPTPATTTTAAQQLSVTLDEGSYSWGVYAIRGEQEEPIFLSRRTLTIHKQEGPKIRTEVHWNKTN